MPTLKKLLTIRLLLRTQNLLATLLAGEVRLPFFVSRARFYVKNSISFFNSTFIGNSASIGAAMLLKQAARDSIIIIIIIIVIHTSEGAHIK